MNDRVPISEFIEKHNSIKSEKAKEMYVQSIIRDNNYYIDYMQKYNASNKILEINYQNQNNENKFIVNGAMEYLLYICTIIQLYTILDIDMTNYTSDYNLLQSNKLINPIIKMLPDDKKEFDLVFHLAKDDLFYKEEFKYRGEK